MDAIKKKMQAMKVEKDNAMDRADAAEEKQRHTQEEVPPCLHYPLLILFICCRIYKA